MSIFASKTAFMQLGLEQVVPSTAHMYQDCYICKNPLDVNIRTAPAETHHKAVRITACGHMHGQECLAAWLETGSSCPFCKRLLFEASGRSTSQAEINMLTRVLRRQFGKTRARSAIARLMNRQEREQAQLRRTRTDDLEKMKAEEQSRLHDLVEDNEWIESRDDEEFDVEDEDEGSDVEDSDEDDDAKPESVST